MTKKTTSKRPSMKRTDDERDANALLVIYQRKTQKDPGAYVTLRTLREESKLPPQRFLKAINHLRRDRRLSLDASEGRHSRLAAEDIKAGIQEGKQLLTLAHGPRAENTQENKPRFAGKPKTKPKTKKKEAHAAATSAPSGPTVIKKRPAKQQHPETVKLKSTLSEMLAAVRKDRAAQAAELKERCKSKIVEMRQRYSEKRARIAAALREASRKQTAALKEECAAERQAILERHKAQAERARALKAHEKETRAKVKNDRARAAISERKASALAKATAARHEQIEAARGEVEAQAPNLLPAFEAMARKLKTNARLSLAEAFFQWAHDNPDQIVAYINAKTKRQQSQIAKDYAKHVKSTVTQTERLGAAICRRAERARKAQRPFTLKASEEAALDALGIDAVRLMGRCYGSGVRRIVSGNPEFRSRKRLTFAAVPF